MLDKDQITETVALNLLKQGYSILKKPKTRRKGADIIARDPESKAKLFISAAGRSREELSRRKPGGPRTESQVLECMTRSFYSALRMRHENEYDPGDRMVLAFPDLPEFQKYLSVEKPVLDSLGVKLMIVKEDGNVDIL